MILDAPKEEYKFEQDDSDDEFGMQNNVSQPPMQKGYSESDDLFLDSPNVGSRGIKRMHNEDDVFNSGSYKRFKD